MTRAVVKSPGLSIPALWRPRTARLFIDVQHGLCNRLRAMASAAAIAAVTERELVVIWCVDHHCEARLDDLLVYGGPVIDDRAGANACRDAAAQVYNYMEIEPGSRFEEPILPDPGTLAGRDIYIRSAYTLTSPHRSHDVEQRFLRRLVPSDPVRALVAAVRHPNRVALHVRLSTGEGYDHLPHESAANWPAERHAQLIEWRARSRPERFIARLDGLIANGQADSIFLATDLPETYALFAERYGVRLAFLKRVDFDRSVAQLQYAMADLMLLTAADLFLASTWSSFSDVAQRLARPDRPCEQSGKDF